MHQQAIRKQQQEEKKKVCGSVYVSVHLLLLLTITTHIRMLDRHVEGGMLAHHPRLIITITLHMVVHRLGCLILLPLNRGHCSRVGNRIQEGSHKFQSIIILRF